MNVLEKPELEYFRYTTKGYGKMYIQDKLVGGKFELTPETIEIFDGMRPLRQRLLFEKAI